MAPALIHVFICVCGVWLLRAGTIPVPKVIRRRDRNPPDFFSGWKNFCFWEVRRVVEDRFMAVAGNQDNGETPDAIPTVQSPEDLAPAYGQGPFSRPLPRPSGCWAGCVRDPCCLTNRPDRRGSAQ